MKAQGDTDCPSLLDVEAGVVESGRPHFGVKCKIFEIDACLGNGRVCLVFLDKQETDADRRETPKIWLLDRLSRKAKEFQFLIRVVFFQKL